MLFPFSLFHESDENGLCHVSYSSNPMERERAILADPSLFVCFILIA